MSYALNQILSTRWAMTEEVLRSMISIAERTHDTEALEKIKSEKQKDTERGSVAPG
ncbi:MAG: hypothetical protein M3Q07_12160 [Pseudobdellovibrionaceae bacterium]|nr:hypothetical protein [Pseudobdellovibrionaceae bacterium]